MLRAPGMLALSLSLAAALAVPPLAPASPRAEDDALRALGWVSAGDPGIAEVQDAAARQVDRDGPALDDFSGRSRLAALLPRLTAEYRREERSTRVVGVQGAAEVDYLRLYPGSAFMVRATWELPTLLASRNETAAAHAMADRAVRREGAVKRATTLYFDRRRAMVALLLDPPATALARAEAELAVDRLTAELDALTGGLFLRGARR